MKKLILILLMALALAFTACSNSAAESEDTTVPAITPEPQSTATANDYFADRVYFSEEYDNYVIELSTAEDLIALTKNYSKDQFDYRTATFLLTNDIDMGATEDFAPIGTGMARYASDNDNVEGFCGQFYGQGYSIKNLTIKSKSMRHCLGFFAILAKTAEVKDLYFENITVEGTENQHAACGGLAGVVSGKVENCYVSGQIKGVESTGGMFGILHNDSVIQNCSVNADVEGYKYTGGFAGMTSGLVPQSYVADCSSYGTVTAYKPENETDMPYGIGGFIGDLSNGSVSSCHAQANLIITETSKWIGAFTGNIVSNWSYLDDCTYSAEHAGNWYAIDGINHSKVYGNYYPYNITADSSREFDADFYD